MTRAVPAAPPAPASRPLAEGLGFAEGPVVLPGGDVAVTSVSQGCVYRVSGSATEVLAVTGGGANGAALGADGSLFIAQMGSRWPAARYPRTSGGVQRVGPGAHSAAWVTTDPISANDLCFGPDGALYVTDPTRGRERFDDGRLWRVTVDGEAELLRSLPWYPNGIAVTPDGQALVVASTGDSRIVRFALDRGRLGAEETLFRLRQGHPDGLAFDVDGNLVVAAPSLTAEPASIQTWSLAGELLDVTCPVASPLLTNVAFDGSTLLVTDATAGRLLALPDRPAPGLALHAGAHQ